MEVLLRPVSSTFSLPMFPSHDRGYVKRNSISFTARRIPVSNLHRINRKWNVNQSFELSALPNNLQTFEKLPSNESIILENEFSPKNQEDQHVSLLKKLEAFYHFCRPYTIIAKNVGVLSVSLLPIQSISDLSPTFFLGVLKALVVGTLNMIYINGMNQLFDIEIDKVNKEFLPLASGELSTTDVAITSCFAIILSIGIGLMSKSPALLCAAVVSFLFGTAYSVNLPYLRWKRHPSLCIPGQAFWCALGLQIPYFIHTQKDLLGRPIFITKSLVFQAMMISLICIPQMMLKDISDTNGDRENGIETVSTQIGEERAFSVSVKILLAEYCAAMIVGATSSFWFGKLISVFGHLALALALWNRSQDTNPTNPSAAQSFYMFFFKVSKLRKLFEEIVKLE
ncbi:homogentisate geranylgeranyltransferase-like [Macadamia integrifolia]|uniref:homogentisate geranylgeranyltransferase-like n=1 Tax=Macadamia integrifolia TaxID=60698 RepID=UPI001C5021A1|nr:homogentisate geranylgeranyltransferase-like [Macadamia integrifolia]